MPLPEMYRGAVNSPSTTLTAQITDVATIIPVMELVGFPGPSGIATIGKMEDAETIFYSSKSAVSGPGNLLGVIRQWDNDGVKGLRKAWPIATDIARNFTRYDHDTFIEYGEQHDIQLTGLGLRVSTLESEHVIWRGSYNPLVTYQAQDAVEYMGFSYLCLQESTGNPPTDTDYWNIMQAANQENVDGGDADMRYIASQRLDGGNANG